MGKWYVLLCVVWWCRDNIVMRAKLCCVINTIYCYRETSSRHVSLLFIVLQFGFISRVLSKEKNCSSKIYCYRHVCTYLCVCITISV